MTTDEYKHWNVTRAVTLPARAEDVWDMIGGFYTIHLWHPDIALTEIDADQTEIRHLRRRLTFPGQPKTVEQLVSMNNADFHYTYKWHAGDWGERVKNYHASLRVLDGDEQKSCIVQWASSFDFPTDAISEFYWNGFRALQQMFPGKG